MPVVVIATYREGDGRSHDRFAPILLHLVRESGAVRVALGRWTSAHIDSFVASRFGGDWAHGKALATYLQRYSDGNPLFVQELIRGLEQDGQLVEAGGGWALRGLDEARNAPLSTVLRATLRRGLDDCGESTRAAIEFAVILGHEFSYEVWRTVMSASDDDMVAVVDECRDRGVLEEVDRGHLLRFRHALVRESLYYDVSLPRRKVLHRSVASTLASSPAADPGIVAHHFQQAGDPAAVEWWVRAARRASSSFARVAAAASLQSAAGLLAAEPDRQLERGWYLLGAAGNSREALESPDPLYDQVSAIADRLGDRLLSVQVKWSRGLTWCYRGRNRVADMTAAFESWQPLGGLWDSYPGELRLFGEAIEPGLLAFWSAVYGHYDEALRWAAAQSGAADAPAARFVDAFAAAARAYSFASLGRTAEAEHWFERTRAIFAALGHRWGEAVHTWIQYMALTLPYQAEQTGVRWQLEERIGTLWRGSIQAATRLPGELGLFPTWFLAGSWDAIAGWEAEGEPAVTYEYAPRAALGEVMRLRGQAEAAWRQLHLCLPGGPVMAADGVMILEGLELRRLAAELAMDDGALDLAGDWIESFAAAVAQGGRVTGRADEALLRAELALRRGDVETARSCALDALSEASSPRQVFPLAGASRLLGRIALEAREVEEASRRLEESERLWESVAVPHELASTWLLKAEVAIQRGELEAAEGLVQAAGRVYSGLGAMLLLEDVHRVRARLQPGAPLSEALTPREASVLGLLARGASNREIGQELTISVRTVERHIANIYAKTGATNRATATVYALRHGIDPGPSPDPD